MVDCDPICCGKPFVVLDIVDSVFQVAVPLGEVHLKKVPQQVLQITTEVRGEPDLKIQITTIIYVANHIKKKSMIALSDNCLNIKARLQIYN